MSTYAYTVAGRNGKPAFALYIFDGGAYLKSVMPGSYDYIRVGALHTTCDAAAWVE